MPPKRKSKKGTSKGIKGKSRNARSKKSAARSSIIKKIGKHSKAIDDVGRENVKRGPKLIGSEKGLTPDKVGIRKMKQILKEIHKQGPLRTFSYGLIIRDKRGKIIREAPRGNILNLSTRQEKFAKIRAAHPKRGKKKLKQSKLAKKRRGLRLLRERINEKIRGDIFKHLPMTDEIVERYKEYKTHVKAGNAKEAEKALNEIKTLRGVTFEIKIYREI